MAEMKEALKEAVEDYLNWCEKRGKEPRKPLPGKFLVRMTPQEHRLVALAAKAERLSLNEWARKEVLEEARQALA